MAAEFASEVAGPWARARGLIGRVVYLGSSTPRIGRGSQMQRPGGRPTFEPNAGCDTATAHGAGSSIAMAKPAHRAADPAEGLSWMSPRARWRSRDWPPRDNLLDALTASTRPGAVRRRRSTHPVQPPFYKLLPPAGQILVIGQTHRSCARSAVGLPICRRAAAEDFIAKRVAHHKRADGSILERRPPDGRVLHVVERRSQRRYRGTRSRCHAVWRSRRFESQRRKPVTVD